MAGVTVVCVVCGLAVSRSEAVRAYFLICAYLLPPAVMVLTLASFSRRRGTVYVASSLGALFGVCCGSPVVQMGPGPRTIWEAVHELIFPITFGSSLGAAIVGLFAILMQPIIDRPEQDER
jgi:hypothetical protein